MLWLVIIIVIIKHGQLELLQNCRYFGGPQCSNTTLSPPPTKLFCCVLYNTHPKDFVGGGLCLIHSGPPKYQHFWSNPNWPCFIITIMITSHKIIIIIMGIGRAKNKLTLVNVCRALNIYQITATSCAELLEDHEHLGASTSMCIVEGFGPPPNPMQVGGSPRPSTVHMVVDFSRCP